MKPRMLTCRELIEFLADYVEGELRADERARFDAHLAVCPHCVDYLHGYRESIRLGQGGLRGRGRHPGRGPRGARRRHPRRALPLLSARAARAPSAVTASWTRHRMPPSTDQRAPETGRARRHEDEDHDPLDPHRHRCGRPLRSRLRVRRTRTPPMAPVRYQVVFERTWSEETHPQDFPLLAHFSPVIGVTHDGSYEPVPRRRHRDGRPRAPVRGGQAPAARRRDPRGHRRRARPAR